MGKSIVLKPVEMTADLMRTLEERGLIIRLAPGNHQKGGNVYVSDPRYGPHKLLHVVVNRPSFTNFGTHPDNEEFLLIGNPESKPLYLAIALCMREELDRRIAAATVCADDFVCLKVRYNDPEVSFFTMLKHVPHGEATADTEGQPATFYVTEPAGMGIDRTDFGGYELKVGQQSAG